MPAMETRQYTVRLLTPAFLGDARRSGEWRTPPFKALLRQWWRVAVAEDYKYNVTAIREAEGKLFGNASLDASTRHGGAGHQQSHVRIRLDSWAAGDLTKAPEIGKMQNGQHSVSASLYSGFGPIENKGGVRLKANAALQANASNTLRLAFPAHSGVDKALALVHSFGTLGGRCRNGWGSCELEGDSLVEIEPLVEWRSALNTRDWPHALGRDDVGRLVWTTKPFASWGEAMRCLAELRAGLRKTVPERRLLAHPTTKHRVPGWSDSDRIANSIRMKVCSRSGEFIGKVFHLPCRPSDALWSKLPDGLREQLPATFSAAHRFLDNSPRLQRS